MQRAGWRVCCRHRRTGPDGRRGGGRRRAGHKDETDRPGGAGRTARPRRGRRAAPPGREQGRARSRIHRRRGRCAVNLTPATNESPTGAGGTQGRDGGHEPAAHPRQPGMVAFAGAGPGDEGLLTLRAAELLRRADLVVGRPDLTGRLAHLLREGVTVADSADLDGEPGLMAEAAKAGQLVVRLCLGDPLLFCRAVAEADSCVKAGVRIEIVPGVSSVTAVPAYAGIPLTQAGSDD